ncbi:MAG: hypothetical protein IT434_18160 [Phycisphaerales bacterium]|nr:hypothetical protein [Phycisphaerales bacterium]
MNEKQRGIIVAAFEEQAARYKTPNAIGQGSAACGASPAPTGYTDGN